MTPREKRLSRLTTLREQLHDVAAQHLRSARGQVAAAHTAIEAARESTRVAQLCRIAGSVGDDPHDWMLACADFEVGLLTIRAGQAQLSGAIATAEEAADLEITARREKKQMEVTLAAARYEAAVDAERKERGTLDEIARRQHASSATNWLSRRDL